MQLSRRRRLIERDENAQFATQAFNTRGYADPVNTVAYATPLRGVQNPQNTPNRSTSNVYGGAHGAFGGATRDYGGAYNATTNAYINEAAGGHSKFNLASSPVYDNESYRPGPR